MKRQGGFTLLEMLAAIALMAVAASVLLGAFGQGAVTLRQVEQHDRLNAAARSLIDVFDDAPLQVGRQHGDWDGIAWTLEVSPQPSGSARLNLYRLRLELIDGARRLSYSTLRLRAAGSGA